MCFFLPYVWLNKRWSVELISSILFIHVPWNWIFFETIPEENKEENYDLLLKIFLPTYSKTAL